MRVSGGWILSGIAAVFVVVLVAVLTVVERGGSDTSFAAAPVAAPADPLPRVKSRPLVFDLYAGKPRNDAVDSGTAFAARGRTRQAAASPTTNSAPTPVSSSPAPAAAVQVLASSTTTPASVRTTAPTTTRAPRVAAQSTAAPKKSTRSKRRKVRSTFKRGVLRTPDLTIRITRYAVIPVGQVGNEYGDKPVIALWYRTTNVSGRKTSPALAFISSFNAFQDNNPDAENELGVGSLPDDRFLDSQTENIKKGRTVENAMAYELDDLSTSVDLVATKGLDETIGKTTYRLK